MYPQYPPIATTSLYDYIYWKDYNKQINALAALTGEQWNFSSRTDNSILKNYMQQTFRKLIEDKSIIQTPDYTLFNTGLFTPLYEQIYVYAEKSTLHFSEWIFTGFYTEYELGNIGIHDLPPRANYFSDPSLLLFDPTYTIHVQYSHILQDETNKRRIEEIVGNTTNTISLLRGEIEMMKLKVSENYKLAVPQYFNGKIQLLLPLCLKDGITPDMALVVSKNETGHFYQGHTCLTIEMAYNNARLISKPYMNWLTL